MKQATLDMFNPLAPDFSHFLEEGPVPVQAPLLNWLEGQTNTAPVLYLWGGSGTGKTHLLQAAFHGLLRAGRSVTLGCEAQQADEADNPAIRPDFFLMDDVQNLSEQAQHTLFRHFVEWVPQGTRVLAAGRLPVVDLPLREDVKTRLGWGLVLHLPWLGEQGVRAVLEREAQRRGLHVPAEVWAYLLVRFERNLKTLMMIMNRLDAYALQEHRAPTVPLLKAMLTEDAAREFMPV
jgi:DnaA family protein